MNPPPSGGFPIYYVDHRELTPFPDAGDLSNASFFLESEVSPVHSLALDLVVDVYAEDSVMHVGDAAMVDTDNRAADAEMMVDLGGLEDVVEGFFAAASAPSPLSLDQVTSGMEVQVPEEEAMVGPGVVASLAAQEKAKLTAWQQREREIMLFIRKPKGRSIMISNGSRLSLGFLASPFFRVCKVSRRQVSLAWSPLTRAAQCLAARRFERV